MISTLIALVLTLITQAQQPNVPIEMRIQALELAQQVLTVAQTLETTTPAAPVETTGTPTPVETPVVGSVVQVPTCTLAAPVVTWRTTQHAQFSWTYTDGATATITSGGTLVPLNGYNGQSTTIMVNDSAHQPAVYAPAIFQDTDYEMDVTLNGQTGSCTAHATI